MLTSTPDFLFAFFGADGGAGGVGGAVCTVARGTVGKSASGLDGGVM
jgi:hypothetical protein